MPQDASLRDLYARDAHEPGRGPVRRHDQEDVRGHRAPARSARPRRSPTPTSTRTRSRTRRSTCAPSRARRPTRATGRWPGPTLIEGDATLLMSLWAQQHLTPAQLLAGRRAPATRRRRPCSTALPAILRETLLFPYTQGLNAVARRLHVGRRLRGRRRPVRQPARLDRAGPPPREARPARGAGRRCRSPTTSRRGSATAGASRSRTRWASSSCGSCSATRPAWTARPPTPRPPAGAATGSRSSTARTARPASVLDTALGHGRRRGRVRGGARGHRRRSCRRVGRSASILTPEPNRVVLVTASSDDTLGRLANVLGLAG